MLRAMALTGVLVVAASACVYPIPGPGEPVPDLDVTIAVDVATATVTVTVDVTDHATDFVRVWPDGFAAPPGPVDHSAPWQITFAADASAPGPHTMSVMAVGASSVVAETADYQITACNGAVSRCSQRYDQVRYVTTHNAMSSAADGWFGPNQNDDVPTQLAAGVRALMLDTYRAGDLTPVGNPQVPGVDPDTGYLCHTLCGLGSQPLIEGLTEIRVFLDDHPGEVVTLIIESYLDHDLTAGAFVAAGLDGYAYTPPAGQPWPALGELVESDARLVVMQDRAVDPAYPWLLDVWAESFETDFDNAVPEDFTCAPNRGNPANDLFILNHFLTQVFGSPALAEQVNHDPLLTDRIVECETTHGATANFVAVDFHDIGDVHAAVTALNGS